MYLVSRSVVSRTASDVQDRVADEPAVDSGKTRKQRAAFAGSIDWLTDSAAGTAGDLSIGEAGKESPIAGTGEWLDWLFRQAFC